MTFSDFPDFPFGENTTVQVSVEPVAGGDEHRQQHGRVPGRVHARAVVSRSPAARSRGGNPFPPRAPSPAVGNPRFPRPLPLTSRRVAREPRLGIAIAAARSRCSRCSRRSPPGARARLRRGQQAILGGSTSDVVDFAVSLQGRIDDLHRAVDEVAAGLTRVDRRVDGAVTNTSVVRYDAYEDAGGQQSASFAFLDPTAPAPW